MKKKTETTEQPVQTERHADQGYRKFWSTMKELTWKQRFQHFFEYYGKYTLIGLFLTIMFVDILVTALTPKPELILSGTAINVSVSVDMEKKLTDDAFEAMGGTDHKKQETDLVPNEISPTDIYTSTLQVRLQAGDFHYVLLDEESLDMLLKMQALTGLVQENKEDNFISAEKLALFEGRLKHIETDGKTVPVAIDITGTVLASECKPRVGDRIYLGFPVNRDNMSAVEPFMDYLISQGLLEMQ